jgi:hypothetical protein
MPPAEPLQSSEFMLQLHKQLVDTKSIQDSTAAAYIRGLYILNGKKPYKSLSFLKKTDDLAQKIESGYSESTQKTIYASITSVLSLFKDKPAYKKTHQFYHEKMMGKAEEAAAVDTAEKTPQQKENWLEWSQIEQKAKELCEEAQKYVAAKTITPEQFESILHAIILSLYTSVPPRRNQDYLAMTVARLPKSKSVDTLAKDKNWLIVDSTKTPRQFIYNVYKTAKTYGQQQINIPTGLADLLKLYLKHHPTLHAASVKEAPFLVEASGAPLTAGNAITRVLNRALGKKIGCSMLRHIYLSGKYDIQEMRADADSMGHSLSQQKQYLKADSAPHTDAQPLAPTPVASALTGASADASAHTASRTEEQPLHCPPAPPQKSDAPKKKSRSAPRNKTPRKVETPSTVCLTEPAYMPPSAPQLPSDSNPSAT